MPGQYPMPDRPQCQATTKKGKRCTFPARFDGARHCGMHRRCREEGCEQIHKWWCSKFDDPFCRTHAEQHFESCPACAAAFKHFYGGKW